MIAVAFHQLECANKLSLVGKVDAHALLRGSCRAKKRRMIIFVAQVEGFVRPARP
jgi:hypothetical protein